jgi:hypothetical protein
MPHLRALARKVRDMGLHKPMSNEGTRALKPLGGQFRCLWSVSVSVIGLQKQKLSQFTETDTDTGTEHRNGS